MDKHELMGAISTMIGEPVIFNSKRGVRSDAVVTKVNQKTIGIKLENGEKWRVSPSFLKHK